MAHRPIVEKKIAKLRRAIAHGPAEFIDVVDWLQLHGHADTAGQARKLLRDGRVMIDSHPIGKHEIFSGPHQDGPSSLPTARLMGNPRVPAHRRKDIHVKPAA